MEELGWSTQLIAGSRSVLGASVGGSYRAGARGGWPGFFRKTTDTSCNGGYLDGVLHATSAGRPTIFGGKPSTVRQENSMDDEEHRQPNLAPLVGTGKSQVHHHRMLPFAFVRPCCCLSIMLWCRISVGAIRSRYRSSFGVDSDEEYSVCFAKIYDAGVYVSVLIGSCCWRSSPTFELLMQVTRSKLRTETG